MWYFFGLAASLQHISSPYVLDKTWQPNLPTGSHTFSGVGVACGLADNVTLVYITQRGNASIDPILVVDGSTGGLIDSWGSESVAIDRSKPPAATWGAHGIAVEHCNGYHCGSCGWPVRIWIDDFTKHTLTAFSGTGEVYHQFGTPGVPGNGTNPLQFGNLADTAIDAQQGSSQIYVSDGDGGTANRVVKLMVPEHSDYSNAYTAWATPSQYANPHSIALHQASGLLVVADREHNQTRLVRSDDGTDLGSWDCGLNLGAEGKPFGVRTLVTPQSQQDLLFVAIMDNPQDGQHQRIAVIDSSQLNAKDGVSSKCSVLQIINIESKYSGPHLLGVDSCSGDVYAALVADSPLSTVLRFKCVAC